MNVETETENSQESETNEEVQTEDTQETNDSLVTGKESTDESTDTSTETETEEFVPLVADDLTFSEGVEVSEELRDEFLGIVNDQEISPKDRAQALVSLQEKAMQSASEASSQAWKDQQQTWQDEVKNDEQLGKGNFQKTLSNVNRLVEQFGSEELVEVFGLTGAGNNIHMIRFLDKIAGVALEGSPSTGAPSGTDSSRASRMFPSMKG